LRELYTEEVNREQEEANKGRNRREGKSEPSAERGERKAGSILEPAFREMPCEMLRD
jgi:hypothetical protein